MFGSGNAAEYMSGRYDNTVVALGGPVNYTIYGIECDFWDIYYGLIVIGLNGRLICAGMLIRFFNSCIQYYKSALFEVIRPSEIKNIHVKNLKPVVFDVSYGI